MHEYLAALIMQESICNKFLKMFLYLNKEQIFMSAFFYSLADKKLWKCIWFPIVSSMHMHHIGAFL